MLTVYFNQNGIQLDAVKWVIAFIATLFSCAEDFFRPKKRYMCASDCAPRATDGT